MFETNNVKEIKMLNQNVGLLALQGRILARADKEINDAYEKLLKQGSKSLIIDFSDTDYLNSAGIGTIMGIVKEIHDEKQKTHAVKPKEEAKMMFDAVGLSNWMEYFESVEDALKGM